MLYNQHPPIMMESDVDQLGLMLETIERLATLDADLVLCGHGDPGSNLTQRCAQVIDHYHRQLVSFKQVCEGGETDPGKLAYLSTHQGKRTPWEDRLIFGRRALIAQTMAYLKHLMQTGVVCTFSLWSFMVDDKHSRLGLWCYEGLRDLHLRLQAIKRPELCVRGMAFGFNTELGRKFGFRTDIIRGEDGSLALAMKPYGKLVFITSRKARVLTSNGTLNTEGTLLNNIWIRVIKALKGVTGLFTKKTEYKDEDSNLIK